MEPVHEVVMDYTKAHCGYLHSILLSVPRRVMDMVAKLAQGSGKLDLFINLK